MQDGKIFRLYRAFASKHLSSTRLGAAVCLSTPPLPRAASPASTARLLLVSRHLSVAHLLASHLGHNPPALASPLEGGFPAAAAAAALCLCPCGRLHPSPLSRPTAAVPPCVGWDGAVPSVPVAPGQEGRPTGNGAAGPPTRAVTCLAAAAVTAGAPPPVLPRGGPTTFRRPPPHLTPPPHALSPTALRSTLPDRSFPALPCIIPCPRPPSPALRMTSLFLPPYPPNRSHRHDRHDRSHLLRRRGRGRGHRRGASGGGRVHHRRDPRGLGGVLPSLRTRSSSSPTAAAGNERPGAGTTGSGAPVRSGATAGAAVATAAGVLVGRQPLNRPPPPYPCGVAVVGR